MSGTRGRKPLRGRTGVELVGHARGGALEIICLSVPWDGLLGQK
jgi:hypothetical protein